MKKTLVLVAMLLGSAAANATPAIWENDFGAVLVAGDDDTATGYFNFAFPFVGTSFTNFEASTNGFISLGGSNGGGCCDGNVGDLLGGAARIAPLWFDWLSTVYLNTAVDGRAVVTWQGADVYEPDVPLTAQAQLFADGRIIFGFDGRIAPQYHYSLSGVSIGGGAADPGNSILLGTRFHIGSTVYQFFAPGDANLGDSNVILTPHDDGFSVGVVPEPATWGLMVAGFGLIGIATRRRGVPTVAA